MPTNENDIKQHMRQHVYEEFQANQISKKEVATQQQRALKQYLEAVLH